MKTLKAALSVPMLFGVMVSSELVAKAPDNAKPNMIFIMMDDQGYGDLGCYGHPTIKTPNIDAMAAHGVRFTDFYARHKCSPARASLMSGAFNFRVGIGSIVHPHSSVGMCKETVRMKARHETKPIQLRSDR